MNINNSAAIRQKYVNRNFYYYNELRRFFKFTIPSNSSVLEFGSTIGNIIGGLGPEYKNKVGFENNKQFLYHAEKKYEDVRFVSEWSEIVSNNMKFDYIILADSLGYISDIQGAFDSIQQVSTEKTRVIISFQNFLWLPILNIAERLHLKARTKRLNWLNEIDILNFLNLSGFEIIKQGKRILFPVNVPFISFIMNRLAAHLPILNQLCLVNYIIAKPIRKIVRTESVSIIVPARNEAGNILNIIERIPLFHKQIELIFIEGHSSDNTYQEIETRCKAYRGSLILKYAKQNGKGKGDAVRLGFSMAEGDILMIYDADMTVPPESLPRFYDAIIQGKGEFINGSRLVYPMEKDAMQALNILGNKFFSIMFTYLLGQQFKDTLCGTKVLYRDDWNRIVSNRYYFGDFDPFGDFDLIFGASKLNLKIIELPIQYRAREYGETNISRFSHGWLLLKMVFFAMKKIKFI